MKKLIALIKKYLSKLFKPKTLRILAIGNSFTVDGTAYLKRVMQDLNVDLSKVVLSRIIHGSSTFTTWINHINNNSSFSSTQAPYCESVIGNITAKNVKDMLAKGWDIIVIQQASDYAGNIDNFYNYEDYVKLLKKYTKKIYYNIPYGHDNGEVFGYKDWKSYVNVVKKLRIDNIIPTGTAIQNARNTKELTLHGFNLTRDNWHLNSGTGRYIAACTWYEALFKSYFNKSVKDSTLTILYDDLNSFVAVTDKNRDICKECVIQAINKPFKIWQQ